MTIAIIPAKSHSRRIPNKNFMDFCGKPLVQWSVEQALNSMVDEVVVSTDDVSIKLMLANNVGEGLITILDRPHSLCTDTTTQEEVIAHAIDVLQLKDDDIIVLLQPTSPLRLPGDIDRCIEQMKQNSAFSGHYTDDIFIWSKPPYASPINFDINDRRLLGKKQFVENGSIYAFHARTSDRYGRRNPNHYVMQKWQQFEIDEPEDIPIVEFFMRKYIIEEGK